MQVNLLIRYLLLVSWCQETRALISCFFVCNMANTMFQMVNDKTIFADPLPNASQMLTEIQLLQKSTWDAVDRRVYIPTSSVEQNTVLMLSIPT